MAEELQRNLQEYKIAKEIAHILRQREEAGLQTYGRSGLLAGIETQLSWTPPTLVQMEASKLTSAFRRLLELQARDAKNGEVPMPVARVRVSERIAEISSRLQERPTILLSEVLEHETSRFVIIVTFIAVLEMWKWRRINIYQDDLFGPITLERGELWSEAGQEALSRPESHERDLSAERKGGEQAPASGRQHLCRFDKDEFRQGGRGAQR